MQIFQNIGHLYSILEVSKIIMSISFVVEYASIILSPVYTSEFYLINFI